MVLHTGFQLLIRNFIRQMTASNKND